jgi:Ca-activated chloride channel family protein
VRVLGRPAEIDGQDVTVKLNQLYSEQEKYVMLEVETAPDGSQEDVEIARISTSYANMLTHETDELHATVSARVSESEEVVQENVQKEPMVAAIQQQGVLNEERAIALRDQGRVEEAKEVLRENAAYFAASAEAYGDEDLEAGADKSLQAIDELDGADWNRQRKVMRADHYKAKVQQGSK